MALAVHRVHTRREQTHTGTATGAVTHWPRGLAVVGSAAFLLSVWGAIVPFLGPTFSYDSNGASSWHWSALHGFLYVLPGAVGLVASLGIVRCARGGRLLARTALSLLGLVVAVCGAWFVLGPYAWPMLGSGVAFTPKSSSLDAFTALLGYNLGVGTLLAFLGGIAIEASVAERMIDLSERNATAAEAETTTQAPYAAAPAAAPAQSYAPPAQQGSAPPAEGSSAPAPGLTAPHPAPGLTAPPSASTAGGPGYAPPAGAQFPPPPDYGQQQAGSEPPSEGDAPPEAGEAPAR